MKISPYTEEKLATFKRYIVPAVEASARAIENARSKPWRRIPDTLYLFDIGCADGADSTALLVSAARSVASRFPISYRLYGFEKQRQRAKEAQDRYADDPNVTIHLGDVEQELASVLASVPSQAFGLAVIDLWNVPSWSVQEQLGKRCQTVDHLVLCCAGGYKRHPDRDPSWQQARIPRANVHRANKKFALIGKPWGPSQHVVMYFTNYEKLAVERKAVGMVALASKVGQKRWEELHTVNQPGLRQNELQQQRTARALQIGLGLE